MHKAGNSFRLSCDQKILIAGARGMVGSALVRLLSQEGFCHLLTPSHAELDYTDQRAVRLYLAKNQPEVVLVAAARVGGIYANMTYPAEFIYTNLLIASHLIHESYHSGVKRLLYLGSSCIYPCESSQPIREEALLTGPLEPTNEAYALAKIAGIKLCQHYRQQYGCAYIAAMPTNLYGPGDNYHPDHSHVIPGLIRRFHEAKVRGASEVAAWGSGRALREFLYVEDLARACLLLLRSYDDSAPINIGSDQEVSTGELAHLVAETVGYSGNILQDRSKPDGMFRKKLDTTRIHQLGWYPTVSLREGLAESYRCFQEEWQSG